MDWQTVSYILLSQDYQSMVKAVADWWTGGAIIDRPIQGEFANPKGLCYAKLSEVCSILPAVQIVQVQFSPLEICLVTLMVSAFAVLEGSTDDYAREKALAGAIESIGEAGPETMLPLVLKLRKAATAVIV